MRKLKDFSHFEPLLDLGTSAALLGVSVSTVTRWVEDGTLAAVITHRGKRKLSRKIRPSTLHAFLAGNATSRPPEGSGGSNLQPPLLPPLAEIRPGVAVGFDGMPLLPPPIALVGEEASSHDENFPQEPATQEGEADVVAPH